jgi:hypothetical protein
MKKLKNVFLVLTVFLVSAFFISSCSDPVSTTNDFTLNAYDYSDNHYFFDTLYRSSFTDFFTSKTGVLKPETEANKVLTEDWNSFEVWIQTDVTTTDKRYAAAITMLHAQPTFGYPSSYKTFPQTDGIIFNGYFRKLNSSEYISHQYAGFVSLKTNIPENYAVAITYTTVSDSLFGTPSSTVNANDTLILKMIKCPIVHPVSTPLAWELKMKNVYRLPNASSNTHFIDLKAVYLQDGTFHTHLPGQTKSLSEMLNIVYYSFNIETGYMVIPSLRPYWDNLAAEGVDPSYFYKELYTHTKTDAANPSIAPNATKYFIRGISMQE